MEKVFITYGDPNFNAAKKKIIGEAKATNEFDFMYSYGREDLSRQLLSSDIIKIKRGGGLWSWKPDIIYSTMLKHKKGDAIVYCDAGCSLYPSPEWSKIWDNLENYDIIAQRIYQRTDRWTRKEIIDYFRENALFWLSLCQFQATVIIIVISDFTLKFVNEWRNLMIDHPEFAMDVPNEKRHEQMSGFVENRHDQAIYSALIYKYLNNEESKNKIYTQWEHIEDYDIFRKQAIRATRLRDGQEELKKSKLISALKRVIKDFIYKPFYYIPKQCLVSRQKVPHINSSQCS